MKFEKLYLFKMMANASFDVSQCGNLTPEYNAVWRGYEFWCEEVLFSSLGLFGNFQ